MAETRIVSADRMRGMMEGAFAKSGMSEEDAKFMGQCLVDADLRGVFTHGCRLSPRYFKLMAKGVVNPRPNIKIVTESPTTAVYDADGSLGHVVSAKAMRFCIERAKQYGLGAATVRNTRHCGAMAYYAQMAADAGCLGYSVTNGGVRMAPFGGLDPTIGLNPLAWAAPTNKPWSVNLDMATSVVAGNKIGVALEKGEQIPLGWATDAEGNPTTDPKEALKGLLLPVGGTKGYGMAVILDIQAGVLGGGRFGAMQGLEPFETKEEQFGQFFFALDIEKFIPLAAFKDRMGQLIDRLKAGRTAPGFKEIFLPGEIEYNAKQRHLTQGIPYPVVVMDEIEKSLAELGVSVPA